MSAPAPLPSEPCTAPGWHCSFVHVEEWPGGNNTASHAELVCHGPQNQLVVYDERKNWAMHVIAPRSMVRARVVGIDLLGFIGDTAAFWEIEQRA